MKNFDTLFVDYTKYATKLKTTEYGLTGKYVIIDQGQNEIAGYTDLENGIFDDVPALIFGDHTRCIKYVDKPFFIGADGVKVLKLKENNNYKYFYYALKYIDIPNTGYNRHFKWLKESNFKEHDCNTQQDIVSKLEKIESILNSKKKQLSLLDDLIKSRFIEMFGDPHINDKNWAMKTFRDICTVSQGLQIPISKRLTQHEEDCYEYITVAYLHGSKEREYIKSPKSAVVCTKDDILMTRTGNTGMVVTDIEGVFHNNFFLIDFDRTKYSKRFLVEYLNLDLIQTEIIKRAGTSTIPDLNHGQFYAISIYEPPIELQNQFAAFVEQTDKSKFEIQKSIDETQKLFDSLMQEYFG